MRARASCGVSGATRSRGSGSKSEEIRDLGDARILHLGQMGFRGPASGVEVDSQLALVITLHDGKIVRSMDFMSHHEALKAVGLEA